MTHFYPINEQEYMNAVYKTQYTVLQTNRYGFLAKYFTTKMYACSYRLMQRIVITFHFRLICKVEGKLVQEYIQIKIVHMYKLV